MKPFDASDIVFALEEAYGFAALSPACRENIKFAIDALMKQPLFFDDETKQISTETGSNIQK